MTKIELWKRKFKRKFFGETYCTIENQSAHDFQFTGGETFSGIRVLFFECRKCGLNATFDHITGLRS